MLPAAMPDSLDVFEAELLSYPARHLPELPVATRFAIQVPGIPMEIEVMTARLSQLDERVLRHAGGTPTRLGRPAPSILFDGDELLAIARAAEAERLYAADFKGFCLLKLQDPGFRVTDEVAFDGAHPAGADPGADGSHSGGRAGAGSPTSRPWSLARLLTTLRAELLEARLLGLDPRGPRHAGPDHEASGGATRLNVEADVDADVEAA
jgi:hypothetical protein